MHLPDIDLMHPRNQIVLIISRIYHNVIPRAKYKGDKLLHTFDRLEVAEFSAKSLTLGAAIGELKPVGEQEIEELRKKFLS